MASVSVSILHEGEYSPDGVRLASEQVRRALPGPATLAFVFVTPDYLAHLEDFVESVRVDGHISEVIGCTASGLIFDDQERESGSGFSLLAIHSPGTTAAIYDLSRDVFAGANDPAVWRSRMPAMDSWIVLANPFGFAVDEWLGGWNRAFPGITTVGGLASGGGDESSVGVFHNAHLIEGAIAIGLRGTLQLVPAVSQGCRPIGDALPVTRAEDNVIFSLGSRPAYQALESAFQSLSDLEKSKAQGNLFAGLANNEYVEEFQPGDFLIRNIIGADPNSGAVVIAGSARIGQTLQYQLRDRAAADADLRHILESLPTFKRPPVASLLFCCTGRGAGLFGEAGHDAALVRSVLGPHSAAGFFCNGEIGPIGGRTCVHGYTVSGAIFVDGLLPNPE